MSADRKALEEEVTVFVERPKQPTPASEADPTVVRPLARPPGIGDVIAEKYRLKRSLGRGGMARIFAADHLLLGITVALKFMHPHLTRDRAQVARFAREARAAATLQSENAARIIDVDQLPTGELYIVMEYLEGTSLETVAEKGAGLPIADAVGYLVQACEVLAEAHARSIIHRDVKPANLFLTKGKSGEPVIKVLDFGLAKSMASTEGVSSSSLTVAGQALGTPHYMAPEQFTGTSPIDGRSDVWALGATLYELLSGKLAFAGPTAPIVFDLILEAAPTPLTTHRPEIPPSLVAIVDRCLMRDPTARFQTVRELSKSLEAFLVESLATPFVAAPLTTGRFVRSSAPPTAPGPPASANFSLRPSVLTLAPAAPAEAVEGPSIRQTVLAALAGPLLLAIAAGVVLLLTSSSAATSAARPARAVASKVVYMTAKSGDPTRAKAQPVAEKHDRPHKP